MINELAKHWQNHCNMTEDLKEEISNMSQDELFDAFYKQVEFGTAGMRGLLGVGSNRLNIFTIRKANVGFAKYLLEIQKNSNRKGVAIAFDNRFMSKQFAIESAQVLASYGIESYVYPTLRSTPQLSFTVRSKNCLGGIMITASHNPKEYNGYKVYDETGCQLTPDKIEKVIAYVNEIEDELSINPDVSSMEEKYIHWLDDTIDYQYAQQVLSIQIRPELPKDIKIVFSPQHGTAYPVVNQVLLEAGYNVILVQEQCSPDPSFANTKSPNPEEPAAYELAIEYAKDHQADVIIVTDPDADRVGIAVNHHGDFPLLTGNQTAAVLLEYIFSSMKEKGLMPFNPVMFNTVVTSDLGDDIAKYYGVQTEKTLTGFKFIGEKIEMYDVSKAKQFVFGYEESYGYLIKPFVRDKDAVQASLMIAEAVQYFKTKNKTLLMVLEDLYKRHGFYLETQTSLTLSGATGSAKIASIMQNLRENPLSNMLDFEVLEWEDFLTLTKRVNYQTVDLVGFSQADVIKMKLSDGSWIAVRPSGTEPKCKFYYCIKGDSMQQAQEKQEHFAKQINKYIQ